MLATKGLFEELAIDAMFALSRTKNLFGSKSKMLQNIIRNIETASKQKGDGEVCIST